MIHRTKSDVFSLHQQRREQLRSLKGDFKPTLDEIKAAKELELMPTTEGGLDVKLNFTQLLDGYPGHEHALPIYPIYDDMIKLMLCIYDVLWCFCVYDEVSYV